MFSESKFSKCSAMLVSLCLAMIFILFHAIAIKAAFGDPDPAFGVGGFKTDYGVEYTPLAFARQQDGKIVVVGENAESDFQLMVRRYLPNGNVDSGFGWNGRALPYFSNGQSRDVVIQSDGKIVVVGIAPPTNVYPRKTAVWRFNSDGNYDSTFGYFGRVTMWGNGDCRLASYRPNPARAAETIVACLGGEIFRLNANGTVNTSFGNNGLIDSPGNIYSLAVRSGTIYVSGAIYVTRNHSISKYTMSGDPDPSFGTQGVFAELTDYGCVPLYFISAEYRNIGFQSDGTIIIAGMADYLNGSATVYKVHLTGHQPNGDFVPGFAPLPCSGTTDITSAAFPKVAIQSDDRILVAAGSIVERRSGNGIYENSYSTNIGVITDFTTLPDGKILTVGQVLIKGSVPRARLAQNLP